MSILPVSTHETHRNPTIPNTAPQARSEAQRAAARANGARSRGPSTPAGKDRARRNALKHGLSGAGVALPDDLKAEADRLAETYARDLRPNGERERLLVERIALADARWRRLALADDRRTVERVRHAVEAWDARRDAEVAALAAALEPRMIPNPALDPAAAVAALRRTAEGCDFLSDAWDALVQALDDRGAWTDHEAARVAHLLGRRAGGPRPDDDAWWRAFWLDVTACRPARVASPRTAPGAPFASLPAAPRGEARDAGAASCIHEPSCHHPSPLAGEGRGEGADATTTARATAPRSDAPEGGNPVAPTAVCPSIPFPEESRVHAPAPPEYDLDDASPYRRLRDLAEAQIAELRERADTLWESLDGPDRSEAPARALFDDSPEGARLARYLNDAERTGRRALAELERQRKGSRSGAPAGLGVEGSRDEEAPEEARVPPAPVAEPAPPAPPAPVPDAPRKTNPALPPLLPWYPGYPVSCADPAARSEVIPVAITPPRRL
jgi:hypothetical protein